MRILITGGLGFIGSHLAASLAADGHELVILDDFSSGKREHAPNGARIAVDDVSREGAIEPLLANVDACYHLAAIASVERSHNEWLRTHQVNIGGTVNLFAAIARTRPIPVVYASSAATYGVSDGTPLKETSLMQPTSSYGADKFMCEFQGRIAERNHHIPNIGLRFFNVFGPRQDPKSPYSGVISIFAGKLAKNQPITIHGDGKQSRDFIYVDDIVRGMRISMDALMEEKIRQGVFNLCTGKGTSILDLAQAVGKAAGVKPVISHADARPGDMKHAIGDPSLAASQLGFAASVPMETGLARTLAWLKEST